MYRHELLRRLHAQLKPRTYLEIGVQLGRALTLSRTSTIGVDPAFDITNDLHCDIHLARTTSDEFFARKNPLAHFPAPVIDLAFIDGMHLAEYALRDLINVERFTHPGSVIVIDDMLPRNIVEASRERALAKGTKGWAGDVFKLIASLRALRPDLICLEVDTAPTGTIVVLLPDATSTILPTAYDDLVEAYVVPDMQYVPDEILRRSRAIQPEMLLDAPIWEELRRSRKGNSNRVRPKLARALDDAGLRTAN